METIFERVGALDVHKAQVTACVRVPGADGRREPHLAEFSYLVSVRSWRCGLGGTKLPRNSPASISSPSLSLRATEGLGIWLYSRVFPSDACRRVRGPIQRMTPARLAPPGVWTTERKLRGREGTTAVGGGPNSQQSLASREIAALVSELEATRWTGRAGYPIRAMVGMALAKSIYAIPTWTKTVALAREHVALRLAIVKFGDDVPREP
jgi:hypothetical protein